MNNGLWPLFLKDIANDTRYIRDLFSWAWPLYAERNFQEQQQHRFDMKSLWASNCGCSRYIWLCSS